VEEEESDLANVEDATVQKKASVEYKKYKKFIGVVVTRENKSIRIL
jgi:hypothetical protein